jgi:type IV pilus biogenesis protein CpaD/CtpE
MDEQEKALIKAMVSLLTELAEEVAQLANPTAGVRWGRVPMSPGERAENVLAKLRAVDQAIGRAQAPKKNPRLP